MKRFNCGDVVPGCTKKFQGESDDDILRQVGAHAAQDHGMTVVPAAVVEQVKSHIHEVPGA